MSLPELSVAVRTHPGLVRTVNEDSVLANYPVYLVADGMGGHEAGDMASQATISAFIETIPAGDYAPIELVSTGFERAVRAVDAVSRGTSRGAGTTLSGVFAVSREQKPYWLVMNIGDSRVYEVFNRQINQLTRDHTLRDEMIAEGMSPDDPELPARNMITRAIGSDAQTPDVWLLPMRAGSRIVIMTDGVYGEIPDSIFSRILHHAGDSEQMADNLLQATLEHGARDNATIIVINVLGVPDITGAFDVVLDDNEDTVSVRRKMRRARSE